MGQATVKKLFAQAGVRIGGARPWDIQVKDARFYNRLLADGSLGAGESYVEGWWDCERLDQLFERILRGKIDRRLLTLRDLFETLRAKLFNPQRKKRAFRNASYHYDRDNDFYRSMLGKSMVYSSAYWRDAKTLDRAQERKMKLVAEKIAPRPGMTLLDIGCGWGSFAEFAAREYGTRVLGITVADNQFQFAKKRCSGLPVEIRLQDYRDLRGSYDRIVSIGMFEHVGYKNYRRYMTKVHELLKENGLFLLQTIGNNKSVTHIDPWLDKYIFPNSMLPSVRQIGEACEGLFVMEDWHNFGPDYDKTLMAWFRNFHRYWLKRKKDPKEPFYRMWKYYLLSCAGAFRAREIQVWQILFSKGSKSPPYLR